MSPIASAIEHFTAADGYRFAVRVWRPPQPRARAIVIHGIVSHGGWYHPSAGRLGAEGVEVHFLDRRGSGLNLAARGDTPSCETWFRDVESYAERFPDNLPTFLLGISWGGKLAPAVAARRPDLFAGVALICPGLYASQQANVVQRAALQLAGAAGLQSRRIAIPLKDPALFTDSPAWQDYIRRDPLTLRRITIRFALEDLKLNEIARAAAEQITIPTLMMLAGRERIIDNHRTRDFFRRIAARDKTLIEYPHAAHTLEFEPDPSKYLDDLCGWVSRRIAVRP
ncbi:MAG: lysophospholipase [Planctomycetes bacterium]|nr:lysophospholipase [Planctomycetota bacterium]